MAVRQHAARGLTGFILGRERVLIERLRYRMVGGQEVEGENWRTRTDQGRRGRYFLAAERPDDELRAVARRLRDGSRRAQRRAVVDTNLQARSGRRLVIRRDEPVEHGITGA